MFDSKAGRFLQRDPIGYADGMNLYHGYFVLLSTDALGLSDEIDCPEIPAMTTYGSWTLVGAVPGTPIGKTPFAPIKYMEVKIGCYFTRSVTRYVDCGNPCCPVYFGKKFWRCPTTPGPTPTATVNDIQVGYTEETGTTMGAVSIEFNIPWSAAASKVQIPKYFINLWNALNNVTGGSLAKRWTDLSVYKWWNGGEREYRIAMSRCGQVHSQLMKGDYGFEDKVKKTTSIEDVLSRPRPQCYE